MRHTLPLTPQFYVTAPQPCPYLDGRMERKLFTALQGDADLVELLGVPGLNLSVSKLQVRLNQGSGVGAGWGPLGATPVIDFVKSYPTGTYAEGDTNPLSLGRTDGYRHAAKASLVLLCVGLLRLYAAGLTPDDWTVVFAVRAGGQVIGMQQLSASAFGVREKFAATGAPAGSPVAGYQTVTGKVRSGAPP